MVFMFLMKQLEEVLMLISFLGQGLNLLLIAVVLSAACYGALPNGVQLFKNSFAFLVQNPVIIILTLLSSNLYLVMTKMFSMLDMVAQAVLVRLIGYNIRIIAASFFFNMILALAASFFFVVEIVYIQHLMKHKRLSLMSLCVYAARLFFKSFWFLPLAFVMAVIPLLIDCYGFINDSIGIFFAIVYFFALIAFEYIAMVYCDGNFKVIDAAKSAFYSCKKSISTLLQFIFFTWSIVCIFMCLTAAIMTLFYFWSKTFRVTPEQQAFNYILQIFALWPMVLIWEPFLAVGLNRLYFSVKKEE